MDPSEILRAGALTALMEGDAPEAERLFSSDLAASGDCLSRAGLAISLLRQGKEPIDMDECADHPAATAYRLESADIDSVVGILGEASAAVHAQVLQLIVGSAERRAAELLSSAHYADHLRVYQALSVLGDDRDRLHWGISAAIEAMERDGHHERMCADMEGLDDELRDEVVRAVERQYVSTMDGERFERAAEYSEAFDFLDGAPLVSALIRAAENSVEYGNIRDALRYYHLASDISQDGKVRSDSAERVLDLARKEMERGELERALDMLTEAVGFADVDVQREYSEIAHGFVREGRYDKAVTLYLDIEERYPGSKTAYHLKDIANRLKSERRWGEAVDLYRMIAELDVDFDVDHYLVLMARDLLDRKEYQAAMDMLADVKTDVPRLSVYRAGGMVGLGDRKGALRSLLRANRRWPDNMTIIGPLSDLYAAMAKPEKAAEFASRALELDRSARWAKARVGEDLKTRISSAEEERDFTGAYGLYTEYLALFPRDRWALGRRNICLEVMRRTDKKAWKSVTGVKRRRWGRR